MSFSHFLFVPSPSLILSLDLLLTQKAFSFEMTPKMSEEIIYFLYPFIDHFSTTCSNLYFFVHRILNLLKFIEGLWLFIKIFGEFL